ncbi:unnamed protein product [Rotaria magnacalcarata]|uniref:Ubiquitin-like domain-containing protein n=2 Tax=Rotaria magnacalcarata TaxID=392030 RepID=A0A8S2KNW6_9BILA|nr:unnamed protein product [Rotaria magnacalcarata]
MVKLSSDKDDETSLSTRLFVKFLSGKTITLIVDQFTTVLHMKRLIQDIESTPIDQRRIVFAGKQLADDRTISDYSIQNESTLRVVLRYDIPNLKTIILSNVEDKEDDSDSEDDDGDKRDVLKYLLIQEEQIRLSQETQQLLANIEDRKDIDWMDIVADLQTELIKKAIGEDATQDEIQYGLHIFRSAHQLYGRDPEFHNLSLYVRHNRAKQGNLKLGDQAVDVRLLNTNGEFVSLLSHCHPNRPLLILAGSYTRPPFRGLVTQLNQLIHFY